MILHYSILTGFLFATIAKLPAAERIFVQYEANRDRAVDVLLKITPYYLQYDDYKQHLAIGEGSTLPRTETNAGFLRYKN